jgi:hypothetical protein
MGNHLPVLLLMSMGRFTYLSFHVESIAGRMNSCFSNPPSSPQRLHVFFMSASIALVPQTSLVIGDAPPAQVEACLAE